MNIIVKYKNGETETIEKVYEMSFNGIYYELKILDKITQNYWMKIIYKTEVHMIEIIERNENGKKETR